MKTAMEMVLSCGCGGNRSDGGCGGDERHHWPATFAGRPGMTNTRRVAMVVVLVMALAITKVIGALQANCSGCGR